MDHHNRHNNHRNRRTATAPPPPPLASDALPIPLWITNFIFFTVFISVSYFLIFRWRDKIRTSVPLHVVSLSELGAIIGLVASVIYLLGFFGISFVQYFVSRSDIDLGIDDEPLLARGGARIMDNDGVLSQSSARRRDYGAGGVNHGVISRSSARNMDNGERRSFVRPGIDGGVNDDVLSQSSTRRRNFDGVISGSSARNMDNGERRSFVRSGVDDGVLSRGSIRIMDTEERDSFVRSGIENVERVNEPHLSQSSARNVDPNEGSCVRSGFDVERVDGEVLSQSSKTRINDLDERNGFVIPGIDDERVGNGVVSQSSARNVESRVPVTRSEEDDEIVNAVVNGEIASYSLETKLGDCFRAASIRREALERTVGRDLDGLPLNGLDYESILGQCCEMPVGYVQIPVGIAGPLLLNGSEYFVPMATTEGCLVASTNRGCKAIYASGGATGVLLRDGMTRAPVVRFPSASRSAQLKFFLEDPVNFDTLAIVFNKSSRFARLQSIQCSIAGKNLYIRLSCGTGDAMGMNMVSKGVQNVLDFLQSDYPDMDVIGISGNFCSDKKPAAVNWIEGRGKSVVCEAVIKEEVVKKVLKTTVPALVELNVHKNLIGSALAGVVGGFNAHAANVVSAVFIATGQDPAQNIESSHCITMMEAVNGGKDLHISVTMPSIEVGTVGGGTQLASQSACLNLLGVKGANNESPGTNARQLAMIVAGAVLAGELSLMSALAAGQLVKSHMRYNRSSRDISKMGQ